MISPCTLNSLRTSGLASAGSGIVVFISCIKTAAGWAHVQPGKTIRKNKKNVRESIVMWSCGLPEYTFCAGIQAILIYARRYFVRKIPA
jgi:hypothetical protein